MLDVGVSQVYSPPYYGQFTPQQLSITGVRIATNEVLSSDNHWSLIRRSIWLSDSWHPLPVPHPDSWSWWSSWLSPRTVITVSCSVIGTRAGSGITRQLLRPSKHGKTGNLKSYFPIFLSFLGKWRTAGDLSPIDLTPDWCWGGSRDHGILVSAGDNILQLIIIKNLNI